MASPFNKKIMFRLLSIGAVTLLCALSLLILERREIESWYHDTGFYFMFATVIVWVYLLLPRTASATFPTIATSIKSAVQNISAIPLLITLLVCAMFLVSPPLFRVLADETNLLGIAASMFDHRAFYNVTEGLQYFQSFHPLAHSWDIRPNFFPFLIYLTHCILGYSAYNGFIVNGIAGAVSLGCFYWLLLRWFPRPIALMGLLALAAYPVFVLWVTSSGFEIVNLTLALISFCWLYQFLATKDTYHLERLVVTLLLLSQTRYESTVFAVGILIVILLAMRPPQYEALSFRSVLWPILFLPVVWQRFLKLDKEDYQVYGDGSVFSLDHFIKHSQLAVEYFNSGQEKFGVIAALSYLACLGLGIGFYKLWQHRRDLAIETWGMALASSVSLVLLCIAIFSYYWGNLTAAFTIRLGVILLPFIVLLAVIFINEIARLHRAIVPIALLCCISLLFIYWPVAAKNESINTLLLHRHYQIVLTYLDEHYPDKNNLIISDRPGMYTVHRWGAIKFSRANDEPHRFINELERRLYQHIIVLQLVDYTSGAAIEDTQLSPAFKLKTVFESQYDASNKLRISEVVVDG